MTLELTNAQYKTLLKLLFCGEWMLNSHKIKRDQVQNETEQIEQLIYSFAKNTGLEKWIEYDKELDMYFPTADMEEELSVFIDDYNNRQRE